MTERARYVFKVKTFADGKPWIYLEPLKDQISILRDGFLGFDLPAGTTLEQAEKTVQFLDDNLTLLTYTK